MRAIDMQVVPIISGKGSGMFKDPEILSNLQRHFRSPEQVFKTEEEMIRELREKGIKAVMMAGGSRRTGWTDFDEIKEWNNYIGHLIKTYPDAVIGAWVCLDPQWGYKGMRELDRCISDLGTFGIAAIGAMSGIPANDKMWYPFYEICLEARVPIKIWVGYIAYGSGLPGAKGIKFETENPIPYVDDVAADFPELIIIAAHMPWPFHHQMIAVMVSKSNVYNELHGWSPKYFPTRLKQEINSRIQDKVMFGTDYPLFTYERYFRDWEAEGYKPEVLEKVYYKNAQRVLESLGIKRV